LKGQAWIGEQDAGAFPLAIRGLQPQTPFPNPTGVVPPHLPLRLKIDGQALVANWRWLARMSGSAACGAAVKADGYGVGGTEVARRLAEAGCRDFFVATWSEAEALLPAVGDASVVVLHGLAREDMPRRGPRPRGRC
jgi:alanine racemase